MLEPAIYRNGIIRGQVTVMMLNTMNTITLPTLCPRHLCKLQIHFYVNKNPTIIKQTTSEMVFVSKVTVKFKTHTNVHVTASLYEVWL